VRDIGKRNCTILYFLDYGKSLGGAGYVLLRQATLMKRRGYKTVVFFSDYMGKQLSNEYEEVCSDIGIFYQWATYQISSQPEDIDLVCIDRNYEALRDVILFYKPNILHSVQLNPCVELISRELKIPHIMNIYSLLPEFFSIAYMDIFPHYHLCDSWYYAQKWKYFLHTDSMCIRNAAERKVNKEKQFSKKVTRYICVGAVYKEKNQLMVIKAFHKALCYGISGNLTICGYMEGSYGEECRRYVADHGLEDYVFLKGFCKDLDNEYEKSDVLICGSTRESYPNVISEAMSHGLIIISTPVGGVPEVICDGENGYLTKDYTHIALTEKIMQLQNDIENGKIREIVDNAERTFLSYHSSEVVSDQLGRYYEYVINDYKNKKENETTINIDFVRNAFSSLFGLLRENKEKITDFDIVSQKLWYIYHINKKLQQLTDAGKLFYIWGTGNYGTAAMEILEIFLNKIRIAGFLDSRRRGTFWGYQIFLPDEIIKRGNVVVLIAAVNGQREMIEVLKNYKMEYFQDYFILAERRW